VLERGADLKEWYLLGRARRREVQIALAWDEAGHPSLKMADAGRFDFGIVDNMRAARCARLSDRMEKSHREASEEAQEA